MELKFNMLKMYTAYTKETDDLDQAITEILEQLKPAERKLKNTLGLVFFHYEFAGEILKFAEAMPFETAGCMSTYSGINNSQKAQHGDVAISVTMFTSDDVFFNVEIIDEIQDKPIEQLREDVKNLCTFFCKEEKPKLIIPFLPTMPHFCGNDLMNMVDRFDKSLLLFGMHVFNIDGVPDTNFVLANGKLSSSMISMIAFYGEIDPKFHVSFSFTFNESFGESVKITDARLSTLKSLNGKPALHYLKKLGLYTPGSKRNTACLIAVPAILTYTNKSKVACAFIGIDEANGYAIAARTLERGAKIVLSQLDGEKTLEGAKEIIKEIQSLKQNDFLAFSCTARVWSIGTNLFSEMQAIEGAANDLNYSIAYSGGEICPIKDAAGNYINMIHNYTLVVCSFN